MAASSTPASCSKPSAAVTAAASLPAAPALWMLLASTSPYASAGASKRNRAEAVSTHALLLRPSVLLPLPMLLLLLAASCQSSSSVSSTAKGRWSAQQHCVKLSQRRGQCTFQMGLTRNRPSMHSLPLLVIGFAANKSQLRRV